MSKKNVIEQMIGLLRTPIAQRKGINIPSDECLIWASELEKELKSLPERFNLQPKQEWSEEDEKNLVQCIEAIDVYYEWDSMIDWLKSLRSRSRWKPSEEQMRALHDMNLTGNISYAGQGQVLIELYNDLKKL